MITVYGPNGETKKINARSVVEWLGDNPGWSLDNPKTPVVDEADDSLKIINQALAGQQDAISERTPEEVAEEVYAQAEMGIYYSGIPNVLPNPNWQKGMDIEEKYVPAQAAYPGINIIPSYEGDLYLSGPNFNPVNIGNMQELLEDAGYLDEDSYNPGHNDGPTKQAVGAWFGDVNGATLNSWATGQNLNIDPMQFLGNQINNRFTSQLQQIKDYTQEVMQTVDRGKMLRDGVQKLVGNRRDYTSAELDAFRQSMNELIDKEIQRNEDIAIFKLNQEFGKLPDPEAIAELGLEGAEGATFMAEAQAQATQPETFSAAEAFIEKYGPEYKSFREYPERQAKAQLNFNNVNRSILGTSMRIT